MAQPKNKRQVGSGLNRLHQELQRQERQNSYIIRLGAVVGHPLSKFTRRLTGRAKGKHRKIAFQFEMLIEESWRLIPDPKAWGIFSEWVHHHRLVGALQGSDIHGSEDSPPSDWMPDHPIVRAARKGNVRAGDGSKFFEPYPVDRGLITIRRHEDTIQAFREDLLPYLSMLEDIRNQLAMELALTKASPIRTRSAGKFVDSALPFAPPQVIKRKRADKIQWKNTTRVVQIPKDADLSRYKVACITICQDGSMCHHLRQPEVSLGKKVIQKELTFTSKAGLPEMMKSPGKVLNWMQTAFEGLDTAERPLFPQDLQGSYCVHMTYPLGVGTEILDHHGEREDSNPRSKPKMIAAPAVHASSMEEAFAAAG